MFLQPANQRVANLTEVFWRLTETKLFSDEKRPSVDNLIEVHPGFSCEDAKRECTKLFLNSSKCAGAFFLSDLFCFPCYYSSVSLWLAGNFTSNSWAYGLKTGSTEFLFSLNIDWKVDTHPAFVFTPIPPSFDDKHCFSDTTSNASRIATSILIYSKYTSHWKTSKFFP